jgi:hypothetical protein
MKRVRLGSAAIAAVKYDEEKRTLEFTPPDEANRKRQK